MMLSNTAAVNDDDGREEIGSNESLFPALRAPIDKSTACRAGRWIPRLPFHTSQAAASSLL
jgi:hypothetical protein